jgi:hypothetical protein
LLEEIAGADIVHQHRGWAFYIGLEGVQPATMLALKAESLSSGAMIRLEVDPGDTLSQARLLYSNVSLDQMLRLEKLGWSIRPNFHFSFRASNVLWTASRLAVAEYWKYWAGEGGRKWFRQVARSDWGGMLTAFVTDGIMPEESRVSFEERFTQTRRDTANICPGLTLTFDVPLEEAAALDDRRQLATHVAKKIGEAVETLKLVLPPRSPR